MKYTVEDTPTGFRLTITAPTARFDSGAGKTFTRTIEAEGSHTAIAEAYGLLERVYGTPAA